MSGHDSKYFSTTKKGEIPELKEELNSQYKDKRKDAVKKVIAAMTVGKDVSSLFTDVVNCMQTENLELKKLVYLYLINYAKSQPDLAILAVNTFVKDSQDPNPLIRALAVRTMGCIRVDKITEYLCDPLQRCLKDDDPYVRKTAAICVAKLYDINAELVEDRYKAADAREAENIVERVTPRLQHANCAVVLSAVKVLLEFKEYATEVDVDFVRKAVRAIGRCAIKLERAAERCISVLLELIKIKVNYVVQEAIIVIKDIFRRYPNTYESIIATLCENLDTLDEPEAKTFPEEPPQVQLQLLTATVKLFLKKPTEGPQQMIQVVLNNATVETDNPDLRDRAYIYWRLLSTDPEAAKDVVLAEKPVISDDSNQLDPSLLDELLANIATLSSKTEEEEYPDGEGGYSEQPGASSPATTSTVQSSAGRPPAAAPAPVPDLLDLMGMDGNNSAIVSTEQPASPAGPPLPILLPAPTGQGLQISAQLIRRDGQIFYSMLFENNSQIPLDGFMIQFNKNTFGLAAGGPLQVPQLQPGTSASTLLPMVLFQNVSPGPPSTLLQVATWKSLPDSNEVSKDFPAVVLNSAGNLRSTSCIKHVLYCQAQALKSRRAVSLAKIPRGIPFLIELTAAIGVAGLKCAIKTPSPEMAPLFFEAIEALLKS
ncbi:hypothetical protein DH2020_036210 [Rehmannia glutinosa]|uniref:Beta-adaptin-like protein n=1 Tax=Rehmannia glutinosa TaxID=99300 RepID=A0ABR0V677_REHGL